MLPDFESSTPGAAFDVMFWPLAPAYPVLLGACSSSDRQNCRAAISLSGYRALQKLQPCNYYLRPSTASRIGLDHSLPRSEERRVGKACVSPCRSGWGQLHSKKKKTKN